MESIFSFRTLIFTKVVFCMSEEWRKEWGIMENFKVCRNMMEMQKRHRWVAFLRRLYNKEIMKSCNGNKV